MRRRNLKCHFDADDILIEGFRLNAVHDIPDRIEDGAEFDFYLDTRDDIYLLRLQNKPDNALIFVDRPKSSVTYIIARKRLSSDINSELSLIIKQLKIIGVPKNNGEITYKISDWG